MSLGMKLWRARSGLVDAALWMMRSPRRAWWFLGMGVFLAVAVLGDMADEAREGGTIEVASAASNSPVLLVVVGAPGEAEYGSNFLRQASQWEAAGRQAGVLVLTLGVDAGAPSDRDRLQRIIESVPSNPHLPFWLVLIGHGTWDGKQARFNLRGPDFTAGELAAWLQPVRRPVVVVNTASASAPFLMALAATNRVVITATRSGDELNYARFGEHLAPALTDPASDLDKDGQTSLLEAFLTASARVAEFYKTEGRLATEHALVDDNGDGLGTPADWFRGVRAVKKPKEGKLDGLRAHQIHLLPSPGEKALPLDLRARRDALEARVAELREAKASLPEEDYYRQLEAILLELARLQLR